MLDLHSFNVMNSISPQWTRAKSNAWLAFASFLVWPFFSLVYAIANWRSPWAKNIVWLFCGFFGFTFVISTEGVDANRYRDYLTELHRSNITFREYFERIKAGELNGRGDYLEPLIRYLVSIFTDDYRFLFAVFGLVMGYFLSRNVWIILKEAGGRIKHHAVPYLVMFILLVPFWQINGFRFWTATHIFFYAILQLYYFNSKKAIFFFLLSYFTHVAFILPVVTILLFYFMPKSEWVFLALLFSSLVVIKLDLSFFIDLIPSTLTGTQVDLVKGYLLEDYVVGRANATQRLNWYVRYQSVPVYVYAVAISLLLLINRKQLLYNKFLINIFYFGVLLFCITNVIKVVPSTGRFYTVAYLCIFGSLFLLSQKVRISKDFQYLNYMSIFFMMLAILVQVRTGLQFIGLGTVFHNPLFGWVFENRQAFAS
jgi:hypothetical protein